VKEKKAMRIVDGETMKPLRSVTVLLTPEEAAELASKVKGLDAGMGAHIHVNDSDFKWEVTVSIYTPDNMQYFREDIRRIILED
jgi:acyl-CoA reductase-like NAD-dependent aldehyde dehydrogenase